MVTQIWMLCFLFKNHNTEREREAHASIALHLLVIIMRLPIISILYYHLSHLSFFSFGGEGCTVKGVRVNLCALRPNYSLL